MGTLRVSVTTGVGVWKCAFVTVNTHCAQIQTETGETREEKRKGTWEKKWKNCKVAVATEAKMHNGGQACSGESAVWLPSQRKRLRCVSQGAPLHACLPDEQVENTAESSWNDLAKQKTLNQALVRLYSRGWEDVREWLPTGRAQEQPKGVLRVNEETG